MSDHDALLAAICAAPDEDTPRLALADWLDEHDQPARAAFVRAQVDLARTPPWEPPAVRARWHSPDLVTGRHLRDTLPKLDGFHLQWHLDEPFRRGLPWRLNVRSPQVWDKQAGALALAPVGELHLSAATLDDWRRFADSPAVPRLRRLHFATSPIEPLRVLRDRPEAAGVTDLFFDRASGAGMPVVVEELLASPLGRGLGGLHFRVGESLDDLIDALNAGPPMARLSFALMGLTTPHLRRLADGPALSRAEELSLTNEPFGNDGVRVLAAALPAALRVLRMAHAGGQADGLEVLTRAENLAGLRRLDLSHNPLAPRAARVLAASRALAGLRSLDLRECRIGDKGVRHLTRAKFWTNLVELDLRGNPTSAAGVRHLLDAPVPADLAALVLSGDQFGGGGRAELRRKYGDRVVFAGG